jgi:hypothetical protein
MIIIMPLWPVILAIVLDQIISWDPTVAMTWSSACDRVRASISLDLLEMVEPIIQRVGKQLTCCWKADDVWRIQSKIRLIVTTESQQNISV